MNLYAQRTATPGGRQNRRTPAITAESMPMIQRKAGCACGGGCPRCEEKAQPKLRGSQPGDALEREADSIADTVMRALEEGGASTAPAAAPATTAPSELSANLAGGGAPLDRTMRGFFEPRFQTDLSGVRIHTGAAAARLANDYSARALTYGNHIVFNAGEYAPQTGEGKRLMAHELAHVQQQARTPSVARQVMRACDKRTTGVDDAQVMMDAARATALSAVTAARAAFKPMKGKTITLLDRHFHCPTTGQMIEAEKALAAIEGAIPTVSADCLPESDVECAGGNFGHAQDGTGNLSVCPPWFSGMTAIQRAVTFIFAAAVGLGRNKRCRRSEACYDDYVKKAPEMLQNPYSFAWFAVEAAKLSTPDNSIVPCRPQGTGMHYVVSPAALKDPTQIRRLSGFDPIPPGSRFAELQSDSSGKYFIYDDNIEGARQYLPDEPKRYYFPNGRP